MEDTPPTLSSAKSPPVVLNQAALYVSDFFVLLLDRSKPWKKKMNKIKMSQADCLRTVVSNSINMTCFRIVVFRGIDVTCHRTLVLSSVVVTCLRKVVLSSADVTCQKDSDDVICFVYCYLLFVLLFASIGPVSEICLAFSSLSGGIYTGEHIEFNFIFINKC